MTTGPRCLIITIDGSRYSLTLCVSKGKGFREGLQYVKYAKTYLYSPYICDKHYGDWLHIWNELTQSAGHQLGYANMVGNIPQLTTPVYNTGSSAVTVPSQILYIPLEFWFNRNPGLEVTGQKSAIPITSCA